MSNQEKTPTFKRSGRLLFHKFYQYLGPSLLLVLAMQLGSFASSIVIGQFLGAEALTASSLAISVVIITQLPGLALGVGLGIVLSKLFSQRKFEEATKTLNSVVVFGLLITILFIPIGIFLTPQIAGFLAGDFPNYVSLISDYISVYFYSAPFFFLAILFCNLIAADNHPGLSSLYFFTSSVVHIILEVVFCLFLPKDHMMVWITLSLELGLLSGFVLLIPYLRSKARLMKFAPSKISFALDKPVFKASLTTLLSFSLLFVMALLLMKTATSAFKSTEELNSYALVANLLAVLDLFTSAVIQMLPPVVSSLYGEKDYSGIRFIVKKALILSLISTGILILITMIYPDLYLYIFGISRSQVTDDFGLIIRLYALSFFFYMGNKFIQTYYPSIFTNAPSVVNTILEKGVVGIPLVIGFMFLLGAKGYSIGNATGEAVSLLLTFVFLYFYSRKKKKIKSFLLLPETDPSRPRYEMTVSNKNEVEDASTFIKEKVLEAGDDERAATYLALGVEELLFNDLEYGYPKNRKDWGIDIILTKEKDSFILSLKDDGVAFDPISHKEDDAPEAMFHGLPLLKKVATRLEYVRILNLNETIMEMESLKSKE
jgi:Na+-driven multidrug efflux pump/anti-sigma regulatory factor (Ser/Thr protein kinase)